jgi:chromosome segregation ATPase
MSTRSATTLDDRIAAAFGDGTKATDVRKLITDAEAACLRADEEAQHARDRALDPTIAASQAVGHRKEMGDAQFRRDRLQAALNKLQTHLPKLEAEEEDHRRWIEYERAKVERDALAAELKSLYPRLALQLSDLLSRIEANDRLIEIINTRRMPAKADRLLGAEAMARDLQGYVESGASIPRITANLVLPAFAYSPHQPYQWSR